MVLSLQIKKLSCCDGRFVQSSEVISPFRADKRLLLISTSYFRVAENNSN